MIVPYLLADVKERAAGYLPYLLEGDPSYGTPPEFWVGLLSAQAKEGNQGAALTLEAAHKIYQENLCVAWRQADIARLQTIRPVARLLSEWMAPGSERRAATRRGCPSESWRNRQLRVLIQRLYIPDNIFKERGWRLRSRLPLKRIPEVTDAPGLNVFDPVLEAWSSVRDNHPDLSSLTYRSLERIRRDTGADGKYCQIPNLYASTGVDPEQHQEALRRWMEDWMGNN